MLSLLYTITHSNAERAPSKDLGIGKNRYAMAYFLFLFLDDCFIIVKYLEKRIDSLDPTLLGETVLIGWVIASPGDLRDISAS